MKKSAIVAILLELLTGASNIFFFARGDMELLQFSIQIALILVSISLTVVLERSGVSREEKIKSLKEMFLLSAHFEKVIRDTETCNFHRQRVGVQPYDTDEVLREQFAKYSEFTTRFFATFSLTKRQSELLNIWQKAPETMQVFLLEIEQKMKLSEIEKLYVRKAKE